MHRSVGALVDERPVGRLLALGKAGGDHDAGRAHLAFDARVLVEAPVDEVLVVGDRGVERDDEPARAAHLRAGNRIDVLPQDGVVLLMDADRVPDRARLSPRVVQDRVEIGDLAQAVAAELERCGHEAEPPLADVERGPAHVVGRWVAVRHHHLGEGHAVRDGAHAAFLPIAERVNDESLPRVEPEPHRPALPLECVALDLEGDALGLGDRERLEIASRLLTGHQLGHVLAHGRRPVADGDLLDLEQLHRVHVDHEGQAAERVRIGIRGL